MLAIQEFNLHSRQLRWSSAGDFGDAKCEEFILEFLELLGELFFVLLTQFWALDFTLKNIEWKSEEMYQWFLRFYKLFFMENINILQNMKPKPLGHVMETILQWIWLDIPMN